MCPLRFILVFFSAVLAGYFAWKTVSSSAGAGFITPQDSTKEKKEFNFSKTIQNGFWVFVDMASGRYLWRNIKQMNGSQEAVRSS